jgi:hypothetical protein
MSALLGFRYDGRPILSFSGGAPDEDGGGDTGGDNPDVDPDEPTGDQPADLGEAGRRAVAQERQAARDAKRELRSWTSALKSVGIESPEQLVEKLRGTAGKAPEQVDVDKVRREAEQAADTRAAKRITQARVRELAATKFTNVKDAVLNVGDELEDFIGRDGEPDDRLIKARLDEILSENPHYGIKKEKDAPDFEGGTRQTAGTPPSWDAQLRAESRRKTGRR